MYSCQKRGVSGSSIYGVLKKKKKKNPNLKFWDPSISHFVPPWLCETAVPIALGRGSRGRHLQISRPRQEATAHQTSPTRRGLATACLIFASALLVASLAFWDRPPAWIRSESNGRGQLVGGGRRRWLLRWCR